MRKLLRAVAALLAFACTGLLAACAQRQHHAWVNESEARTWAEDVVTMMDAGDYDTLAARHVLHTPEELAESFDAHLERVGALTGFVQHSMASGTTGGTEYVTVYLTAQHANKRAIYTITFWQDGSIAGLLAR